MCGIWALIRKSPHLNPYDHVKYLQARGPEDISLIDLPGIQLGFTRLAINGLNPAGMQPFTNGQFTWMCNGEIYNWKELAKKFGISCTSGSDCEILGHLFQLLDPTTFFRALDGVFSMVIVDHANGLAYIARDPYGVRPLFFGLYEGQVAVASEMKALVHLAPRIEQFLPGYFLAVDLATQKIVSYEKWHSTPWIKNPTFTSQYPLGKTNAAMALRFSLEEAVKKRLMTERPVAALLSGGVDSSLIAAIVQRQLKALRKGPLETFSIGFAGSPDLYYAKRVADWIGSKHYEIVVTPEDFLKAIPEVIWAIESYDITSVRASVGNYLVAKAIRAKSSAKVVFNGDGADEIFGSYKYFARAPSDEEFEADSHRLLNEIHLYDGLRSDRCISSHGLEPRTPFLDKQFVAVALSIGTEYRRMGKEFSIEKGLLRDAFSVKTQGDWIDSGEQQILPDEVLWRKKEAFSDGVSKAEDSWHDIVKRHCLTQVPIDWAKQAQEYYSDHLMPETEEAFVYRRIFHSNFGSQAHVIPHFWLPRWCGDVRDPSARVLSEFKRKDSGSSTEKMNEFVST